MGCCRRAVGALATLLCAAAPAAAADTVGLFSPADALFFLKNALTPGPADLVVPYGAPASDWIPLAADWDADETDTIGIYSLDRGLAGLRLENAPGFADVVEPAPRPRLLPIVGDWAGSGEESLGWYDPATGVFTISVRFLAVLEFPYGPGGGNVPLAGDWDGDGKDSIGVYVDETDVLFLKNTNAAGPADIGYEFSPRLSGERVIAGDFDGDGIDTVARFDPASSTFFIHDDLGSPEPTSVVRYGSPGAGWLPFAWKAPTDFEILDPRDGFGWIPRSGPDGTATARLRSGLSAAVDVVEAHRAFPPSQATLLGTATFVATLPRAGSFWEFDRPGAAFGRDFYVVLLMGDGRTLAYRVPDGATAFP